MAKAKRKSTGAWGIDIGQCALKALRCSVGADDKTIVAEAYDYIEYPKILSQPDADPVELIKEALEQFLSRNDVKGDKIAMSVSGQAGLARFFKPPPIDAKIIPDIVKFEARQQIPFALEDVIWDYQRIGGTEVDGFIMDAEIGIFAMKRDAVFKALQPFLNADVEMDIMQLSPLSVFNFVCHDVLTDIPEPEDIDPDNPPESLVILAMGTETTDLVITNGLRFWQRNIPLGGNHFTKQLTKELKLTYAKAEHLKRNARQAEDPKTVFQVMRPVFNDLVTEIQRSIGYFQSIDRQAKIGRLVMLGNAVKLPGLRQYLSKNLGHEVLKLDSYGQLSGSAVTESKSFKENFLSFSVCYGLCLQALDNATLSTNLLPREFMTERLIRAKKPWAIAGVAILLLALSFSYFFIFSAWNKVHPNYAHKGADWESTIQALQQLETQSTEMMNKDKALTDKIAHVSSLGRQVVGDGDRNVLWLELLTAINQALPRSTEYPPGKILDPKVVPYLDRVELQIEYLESTYYADFKEWFTADVQGIYDEQQRRLRESRAADEAGAAKGAPKTPGNNGNNPAGQKSEKKQPGWVIEMGGYHYHNSGSRIDNGWKAAYVRNTLLKNLRESTVTLPNEVGEPTEYTYQQLGIGFAILKDDGSFQADHKVVVSTQKGRGGAGGNGGNVRGKSDGFDAPKYSFIVQFWWQETPRSERAKKQPLAPAKAGGDNVALDEQPAAGEVAKRERGGT